MPFQVSPGVNVTEVDLSTIVPAVATTDGAFAGSFNWGPVDEITLVNNQETLLNTFGKPDNNTADYWFTASNFLDYGNKLHLVRVVTADANNASEVASTSEDGFTIKNRDEYFSGTISFTSLGKWGAKYPGALGNSIRVSVCDSYPGQFSNVVVRDTANCVAGSKTIYLNSNTNFLVGDVIEFRSSTSDDIAGTSAITVSTDPPPAGKFIIESFPPGEGASAGSTFDGNEVPATLNRAVPSTANNVAIDRYWEFYDNFDAAPGTSPYAEARGSANDEIHIAVSDSTGEISGTKGTVLETFPNLSKASDAKNDDGSSNYYKDVINERSDYIWWLNHPSGAAQYNADWSGPSGNDREWGNTASFATASVTESFMSIQGNDKRSLATQIFLPDTKDLLAGNNGFASSASAFQLGYDFFKDAEETDVSLILGGPADGTLARYIIENIAEDRKDAVAFISPQQSDVAAGGTLSQKLTNVKNFRLTTDGINSKSSSYGVMDCGWKYQYDKFNDIYRWVPLNGDVAGLCVQTDLSRDPWWSPAGLNRGNIKNVVKLAWNPQKAHRDELYKNGINPVVTIPGQGTVLWGDKTLLTKPSAFDRINVRRLFIVLEKAIATAAKFTLFEFNDEFTRSQFKNLVEPFLRDVQGRRGIYDFRVVCDETNNTPEVIDRNEFVGDIYIKPARSINFIQLNFVAVRTGVSFEEIIGRF